MSMHSDGFYLHQFLKRLHDLETRLSERLPEASILPSRAKSLREQIEKSVMSLGDVMLDQLLENVFLPELERLMLDVRDAMQLTQHARKAKNIMMTPRQSRLLELSTNAPDVPDVPLFARAILPKRDPSNRDKIEDALVRLKEFLA